MTQTPTPTPSPTGDPGSTLNQMGIPTGADPSASPTTPTNPAGGADYLQQIIAQAGASKYTAWWGYQPTGSNVRQPDAGSFRNAFSVSATGNDTLYNQNDMTSWLSSAWQDPSSRTMLLQYALATGHQADFSGVQSMWLKAGQISSDLYNSPQNKQYMTPFQVLALMAGNQKMQSGRRIVSSASSSSRSVSYDISDPLTAKALTNAVLQAALGRQATDQELSSYKQAINAYEQAHPAVSTSTSSSTTSTDPTTGASRTRNSTTNGSHTSGATAQGRQQVVQDIAQNSAEGQAYMTQDVFEKALQVLAGRIG